LFGKLFAFQI